MGFFLVELPDTGGATRSNRAKAAVVEADDANTAKAMADSQFEGDSAFANSTTLTAGFAANYSGYRHRVRVSGAAGPGSPNLYDVERVAGAETLDQLGLALANKICGSALSAGILSDNGAFTDDTTDLNDADAGDVALFPATPVATEDSFYFGFSRAFKRLVVDVGTAGVGTYVLTWQYWNGSTWAALSGVAGTDFKTTGRKSVTWTAPTDWAANTVNSQGPFFYVRALYASGTMTTVPLATQAFAAGSAAASYNAGTDTLTAAEAAESVGDRTLVVEVYPPNGKKPVTQLVGTITHQGSAGAALTVVLAGPTAIPAVVAVL